MATIRFGSLRPHSLRTPFAVLTAILLVPLLFRAADHNDPNGVNSIFADIDHSAADLYDFFGFPSDDSTGGEKVVLALTFAPEPSAGILDKDLLYRILVAPSVRFAPNIGDTDGIDSMVRYFRAVRRKYVSLHPAEIRVVAESDTRARVSFLNFPGGTFTTSIDLNRVTTIDAPDQSRIKAYLGGRDDAFFNDLPGFFRSINYAPQFYLVPHTRPDLRELPIPKTLIELEGNNLFNFDPAKPRHGQDQKFELPNGSLTWSGNRYLKDEQGNYRFVYSGRDAQAGININALIFELPLSFLTRSPSTDRVVNAWGESWVLKAAQKVETIPDDRPPIAVPFYLRRPWAIPGLLAIVGATLLFIGIRSARRVNAGPGVPKASRADLPMWLRPIARTAIGTVLVILGLASGMILTRIAAQKPDLARAAADLDEELRKYKLVDTDGQPFADAALNQREDDKQVGAYNFSLGPDIVRRLAHLGWGFGPSITALGLRSSFDHGDTAVSVHREYSDSLEDLTSAFLRVKQVVFQQLNMPDDRWNKKKLNIPLKRPIEIFIPNVCAIDMDTTGTWPYGRRLEDQVATRFLALFLDMKADINGQPYHLETLGDPALWQSAPIQPKTPPNPLKNDKPFLDQFPYLADPW